jgi:hypothetical protein
MRIGPRRCLGQVRIAARDKDLGGAHFVLMGQRNQNGSKRMGSLCRNIGRQFSRAAMLDQPGERNPRNRVLGLARDSPAVEAGDCRGPISERRCYPNRSSQRRAGNVGKRWATYPANFCPSWWHVVNEVRLLADDSLLHTECPNARPDAGWPTSLLK